MVELPGVASHLDNSQIGSSAAADELPLHRPPRSMRQHVRARGKLVTHRVALDDVMKAYDTFGNAVKEGALTVILKNQRKA